MRILMLNYEYPPMGGGGSNAYKYILKMNIQVDNPLRIENPSRFGPSIVESAGRSLKENDIVRIGE